MDSEIKKHLFDILESIESIGKYLGDNLDFRKYAANKMLRRAIEREFEIIADAMGRIEKLDPTLNITGKSEMISLRDRVIQGYDDTDDEVIWGTIVQLLPKLKTEIQTLLR